MDIKDLEYVVEIANTKSFSKAASNLYVSQPALSQAIKRLERYLDLELFFRDRNNLKITDAGEYFVEKAEKILKDFSSLENDMKNFNFHKISNLYIGISQFYGKYFLKDIFKIFKTNNFYYNINIIEGESRFLESQILQGHINMGIFPQPIYDSNLKGFKIAKEEILLAINTENIEALNIATSFKKNISLTPFQKFSFILLKKGLKLRTHVENMCNEQGFQPNVLLETLNLDTCLSLVENNYGLTFLPSTILKSYSSNKVRFFSINSTINFRYLMLVANSNTTKLLDLENLSMKLFKE